MNFFRISVLLSCTTIAACGGGGGDSPSVTAAPTAVQSLVSSGGDIGKYTGRWVSSCGVTLPAAGIINTFQFGAPSASVVTGTLTSQRFTGLDCTGSGTSHSPTISAVTVTFLASVPVTSGTPASASGTADLVKTDVAGSSSATQTFAFFPDFRTFEVGGPTAFFNSAALPYKKQ